MTNGRSEWVNQMRRAACPSARTFGPQPLSHLDACALIVVPLTSWAIASRSSSEQPNDSAEGTMTDQRPRTLRRRTGCSIMPMLLLRCAPLLFLRAASPSFRLPVRLPSV
jgi:hypothetical protein